MGVRATSSNLTMTIDLTKYEGHTEGPWDLELWLHDEAYIYAPEIMTPEAESTSICKMHELNQTPEQILANGSLMADAPLLLEEIKRLQKALHTEQQIVQAFYEYRDECCFDHCEAWMLEKGHRVIVDGQSEWKEEEE